MRITFTRQIELFYRESTSSYLQYILSGLYEENLNTVHVVKFKNGFNTLNYLCYKNVRTN